MSLCANTDGIDKRCPLVIGKSVRPRCFKGGKSLPVGYLANKKSRMTRAIFRDWIIAFNRDMKVQNHKVCLLIDNYSAHNVEDVELENVEVRIFPPKLHCFDSAVIPRHHSQCRKVHIGSV